MEIATRKFAHLLLSLALIVFLSITFFSISQTMMGMEKQGDGTMSGCVFSGKAKICTMTFFEHLAGWQQLFTVPQVSMMALILSMIVGFGLALRNVVRFDTHNFLVKRFFVEEGHIIKIFNYLANAFSSGILHPKIY